MKIISLLSLNAPRYGLLDKSWYVELHYTQSHDQATFKKGNLFLLVNEA